MLSCIVNMGKFFSSVGDISHDIDENVPSAKGSWRQEFICPVVLNV